jgi:hypothetical protein
MAIGSLLPFFVRLTVFVAMAMLVCVGVLIIVLAKLIRGIMFPSRVLLASGLTAAAAIFYICPFVNVHVFVLPHFSPTIARCRPRLVVPGAGFIPLLNILLVVLQVLFVVLLAGLARMLGLIVLVRLFHDYTIL